MSLFSKKNRQFEGLKLQNVAKDAILTPFFPWVLCACCWWAYPKCFLNNLREQFNAEFSVHWLIAKMCNSVSSHTKKDIRRADKVIPLPFSFEDYFKMLPFSNMVLCRVQWSQSRGIKQHKVKCLAQL